MANPEMPLAAQPQEIPTLPSAAEETSTPPGAADEVPVSEVTPSGPKETEAGTTGIELETDAKIPLDQIRESNPGIYQEIIQTIESLDKAHTDLYRRANKMFFGVLSAEEIATVDNAGRPIAESDPKVQAARERVRRAYNKLRMAAVGFVALIMMGGAIGKAHEDPEVQDRIATVSNEAESNVMELMQRIDETSRQAEDEVKDYLQEKKKEAREETVKIIAEGIKIAKEAENLEKNSGGKK
ncbi:MAG: hypothetical protein ACOYUZ_03715 [Patescibacteria group bacterium]